MQFADWLQGPYIYALYGARGFTQGQVSGAGHSVSPGSGWACLKPSTTCGRLPLCLAPLQIGILFVAGFGSALILGTFIGSLADKTGRRLNCLAFAVVYSVSCMLTHSESFELLIVGRILGGIAGSILNTAFEAWMVSEHNSRGFNGAWLGSTFSFAIFGSGVAAISAGLVAAPLVSRFGVTAPFDLSAIVLCIGAGVVLLRWNENYGSRSEGDGPTSTMASFTRAIGVLTSNGRVVAVGATQSLFEAAMYIFVFYWTPTLESSLAADESAAAAAAGTPPLPEGAVAPASSLPHGIVFAAFMVSVMIGSKMFESFSASAPVEQWGLWVFLLASAALATPVFVSHHWTQVVALCVFEGCCGVYFPLIAVLRGKYIPEDVRSTLMNLFRVGLNIIVLLVLGRADELGGTASFALCATLLAAAMAPQAMLRNASEVAEAAKDDDGTDGAAEDDSADVRHT